MSDDIPGLSSLALTPAQTSVLQTLMTSTSNSGSPMNVEKHTLHVAPGPVTPARTSIIQTLMASKSKGASPMNLDPYTLYAPSPESLHEDSYDADDIETHIAEIQAKHGDDPEEDGHNRRRVYPTPWTSTFDTLSARPFASPTKSVAATPVKRAIPTRLMGGPSFAPGVSASPFSPTPAPRKKPAPSKTAEAIPWLKKMVKLHRQTEAEGIALCYMKFNEAGGKSVVHSAQCRSSGGKGRAILYVADSKKDPTLATCREVMYEPFAHITPRKNTREAIVEAIRKQVSLDHAKRLLGGGSVKESPDVKAKTPEYTDVSKKAVVGGKKVGKIANPVVQTSGPYQKRDAKKKVVREVEDIAGKLGGLQMFN